MRQRDGAHAVEEIADHYRLHYFFEDPFQPKQRLAQVGSDAPSLECRIDDPAGDPEHRVADAARDARKDTALLEAEIDLARRGERAFKAQERVLHESRHLERLSPAPFAGVQAHRELFSESDRERIRMLCADDG